MATLKPKLSTPRVTSWIVLCSAFRGLPRPSVPVSAAPGDLGRDAVDRGRGALKAALGARTPSISHHAPVGCRRGRTKRAVLALYFEMMATGVPTTIFFFDFDILAEGTTLYGLAC